jgi:hypothetical protein
MKGPVIARIAACCTALALGGCNTGAVDDLPRQAVWGKVTLDGTPLAHGSIQFTPASESPTPAMVPINEGSYSIPKAQGLVAGSYKVSIVNAGVAAPLEPFGEMPGKEHRAAAEAADKAQRAAKLGKKGASSNTSIPARYNTSTTLTAEVKEGGSNSFDFALTSADTPSK